MDNIRVKEDSLNNWRAGFEIEEGKKKGLDGKACWDGYKLAGTKKKGGKTVDNCVKEDQVDEGVGALIKTGVAAYGLYKGGQWLKKKGDEALENAREKSKIGGEYRRKQIEKNTGVKLEQIEGGISVQNYADGVQFTEIETVDIIKAKPLREYKNIGPARVSPEAIDKPESEIGKGDNTILPERKPKGGKTKEIRIPLSTNEELTKMGKKDLLYRPETDNEGNIIPPKKSDLLYRPKTDKAVSYTHLTLPTKA